MTNVLDRKNILSESTLIEPHGGKLVDRVLGTLPNVMNRCFRIPLSKELQMDVEQLAIGTFSPLEGFLNEVDFHSVLDHMRLDSGIVWPLPIILDITEEQASSVFKDDNIILTNDKNETFAILHVEDKYRFDKTDLPNKCMVPMIPNIQGFCI
jgi:sulfate adenylyltransferase